MDPEFEAALSLERFARYLEWAAGDRDRALDLYALNTQLSEALYTPLQVLEVALRNRVHSVLSEARHDRWFEDAGFLLVENQRRQLAKAYEELNADRKDASPGRIVAALTFSFWTSMLAPDYEVLWQTPNRSPGGWQTPSTQGPLEAAEPDPHIAQPGRSSRTDSPLEPAEAPREHRADHALAVAARRGLV